MPFTLDLLATPSLAVWLYLTFSRGFFWRLLEFDDDLSRHEPLSSWPQVVAIVPARNEEATIRQSLTSLLQQNYRGEFSVVVVDDHSEDGTAHIARQTVAALGAESRAAIWQAAPLPPGWTGKLWALNEGVSISRRGAAPLRPSLSTSSQPGTDLSAYSGGFNASSAINDAGDAGYYWFTDADIVHAPDTLQRLVSRAERDNVDLTSLMVLLQAKTLPERALIPAFLFFFLKLYPPRWIANPAARTAGAAGGCILLRREALERIGGFAAIRGEIIDDCALARAVKRGVSVHRRANAILPPGAQPPSTCHPEARVFPSGSKDLNDWSGHAQSNMSAMHSTNRIWMGLTRQSISLREYRTFAEIRDLITRTAFTQLHHSAWLLLGTLIGMSLTYFAPVALLFANDLTARILGACAWTLMSLLYLPTLRFYKLSPLWAPLLPLVAVFYSYATLLSAVRHYSGSGARWKGRTQNDGGR